MRAAVHAGRQLARQDQTATLLQPALISSAIENDRSHPTWRLPLPAIAPHLEQSVVVMQGGQLGRLQRGVAAAF